jgi:hypothetical protein
MALGWMGTMVAMVAGGAVGVFLAPVIRLAIARNARPVLKAAMQAGLLRYEQGREAKAELGEIGRGHRRRAEGRAKRGAVRGEKTPRQPPPLTWTEDNLLRQIVYDGLQEDKPVAEVYRAMSYPKPAEPVRTASRSNAPGPD